MVTLSRESENTSQRVNFKYTKATEYRVVHGSGAYGGLTGQGNIEFDIYTEYKAPPKEESKMVDESGKLVDTQDEEDTQVNVERERQVGIVMNLNEAKSFANWLKGKVNDLEKLQKSEGEKVSHETKG